MKKVSSLNTRNSIFILPNEICLNVVPSGGRFLWLESLALDELTTLTALLTLSRLAACWRLDAAVFELATSELLVESSTTTAQALALSYETSRKVDAGNLKMKFKISILNPQLLSCKLSRWPKYFENIWKWKLWILIQPLFLLYNQTLKLAVYKKLRSVIHRILLLYCLKLIWDRNVKWKTLESWKSWKS